MLKPVCGHFPLPLYGLKMGNTFAFMKNLKNGFNKWARINPLADDNVNSLK